MDRPHAESGNLEDSKQSTEASSREEEAPKQPRNQPPRRHTSDWIQENQTQSEASLPFGEVRKRIEQFRLLEEEATEYAIVLLGPDGNIASWNRGAGRLTGYSEQEMLGRHVSVFYPPEATKGDVPEKALEVARRKGRWSGKGWRTKKDGSRFWAQETIRAIVRENDAPEGFAIVMCDVTSRRRLEKEILRVQEEEWRRIKDDLHEVTGSQLTGASLLMDGARETVEDESLGNRLQKIKDLIAESCEALKKISRKLSPTGLSKGGLPEALSRLAQDAEGVRFESGSLENGSSETSPPDSEMDLPELRRETAAQLYWIAREATTTHREGEPADIVLRLTEEKDALVLLIKDDSGRLRESTPDNSSEAASDVSETPVAVRTMRRRANLLGADLTVESFPGDGTRIQCRLPR